MAINQGKDANQSFGLFWYWMGDDKVTNTISMWCGSEGLVRLSKALSNTSGRFFSLGTWEGHKPNMREMEGKQEEIELSPFGLGRRSIYPFKKLLKFLENLG